MKRRHFLAAAGAALPAANVAAEQRARMAAGVGDGPMKAGFARVSITPPLGTTMMGFGTRDMEHGCTGIHDDIYVRALFLEQGREQAVILAYDLCFVGREDADRFKGAIGRRLDLCPSQILMNTSHNHVGPSVGTWYSAGYEMADRLYLQELEEATVRAVLEARTAARDCTLRAAVTTSRLPVNRRRQMPHGGIENRPNPAGYVYDKLPVCLLEDGAGAPIALLFSVSCHPSMMSGWEISAEYPGAATRMLDNKLGAACSMFLQGVGGDAKPRVIAGPDAWQPGTWELMDEAGAMLAGEVRALLDKGLDEYEPALASNTVEMSWALEPAPPRSHFEELAASVPEGQRAKNVRWMWANHMLERLDRGDTLPDSVALSLHGVQLGHGLRIAGMEGEATAPWGRFIESHYQDGLTFPLGYCDGQGLYLPNSEMLPEGGYEVVSYWEYRLPSQLAPGMEARVTDALQKLMLG